jgi:uncharacterized protein YceK
MKNILKSVMLLFAVVIISGCSKVPKTEKPDASFVAHKLDIDGNVIETSSTSLTVNLVTKTIAGVDQKVAMVGFEFTGNADHTTLWTGDSVKVKVPTKVDGITLLPTEWGFQIATSDYDRYLNKDYSQKGVLLTDGKISYKYWRAGTYKAYMIATNADEYNSAGFSRDMKSITITVTP